MGEPLSLVNATLRGPHISKSYIKRLSANSTSFAGSLYIRLGTVVDGEIALLDARIKGDFQLCDVVINPTGQDAIFAPSLRVEGSVFLGNYPFGDGATTLTVNGALFFSSARVEHDFSFPALRSRHWIRLWGAPCLGPLKNTAAISPCHWHGPELAGCCSFKATKFHVVL